MAVPGGDFSSIAYLWSTCTGRREEKGRGESGGEGREGRGRGRQKERKGEMYLVKYCIRNMIASPAYEI